MSEKQCSLLTVYGNVVRATGTAIWCSLSCNTHDPPVDREDNEVGLVFRGCQPMRGFFDDVPRVRLVFAPCWDCDNAGYRAGAASKDVQRVEQERNVGRISVIQQVQVVRGSLKLFFQI